MNHQADYTPISELYAERNLERIRSIILCICIGTGLAAALIAWWS